MSTSVPSFENRYLVLSRQLDEMTRDVSNKFAKLSVQEQEVYRSVRENLDKLVLEHPLSVQDIKAVQKLSVRLEQLAAQVQKTMGSFLGVEYVEDIDLPPDHVVPLCSGPKKPSEVDVADNPILTKGMRFLDRICDCIGIKGDGDCLFRSFTTGLLIHFVEDKEKLNKKVAQLQKKFQREISPHQWESIRRAMEAFVACRSEEDVVRLMDTKELSDSLTLLMRYLAIANLRHSRNEDLQVALMVECEARHIDKDAYLDLMLTPGEWGGEAESLSLSLLFGLPVAIQNVEALGRAKNPRDALASFDSEGINLLFMPGHYHLAVVKP